MKHQSLQKLKIQDTELDNEGPKRPASKSKSQPICELLHKKPLAGRIFYLDLQCNKWSQALENDIKSLGGTVEKFFSKEIRYLVSSKPEARHVHRLVQDSPVPSPDSGLSSPHPASRRDSHGHRSSSQGAADTGFVSRGKSLVEKVVKEQERIQMNRILANALEWGVKILYIDDVISYIAKKKHKLSMVSTTTRAVKTATQPDATERSTFQKSKAGRISRPFVKVEDCTRHYRPLYLSMAHMPACNFRSAAPCSPFLVEENDNDAPGKKQKVHGSEGDRGKRGRKDRRKGNEGRARRKGGYCECCIVKYDSLKAHLQSEQHQAFSKSEEYLVVDRVISGLTCDLLQICTQRKRVKCSVSSTVFAPGPTVKGNSGEGVLQFEEEKPTTFPFWSSHNTDFSSETPRMLRKRCRQNSQSPGVDTVEQSDALEKSESKRGSFEWESRCNAQAQKPLGASLSSTKRGPYSHSLQKNRTPLEVNSKLKVLLSANPPRSHSRTLQSMAIPQKHEASGCQETQETTVASGPSRISRFNLQNAHTSLLEITDSQVFKECSLPCSGHVPLRTQQASDIVEKVRSSSGHEPDSAHSPCRTLQRKVRNLRPRRKVSAEAQKVVSGKNVESLTPQTLGKAFESPCLSTSALDFWQLFKSSDEVEEFKGFENKGEK
ncbi:protein DBF4 homolog A [Hoplias malabaricus]|uniref:protein DBF4 homolog A n=1 Tax=Hoplias malabaricus TaxID=27720 RepID=UPI0034637D40